MIQVFMISLNVPSPIFQPSSICYPSSSLISAMMGNMPKSSAGIVVPPSVHFYSVVVSSWSSHCLSLPPHHHCINPFYSLHQNRLCCHLLRRHLCYDLKFLGLDRRITLVLSNTRELDRDLSTN